jgi:hypothetical protein
MMAFRGMNYDVGSVLAPGRASRVEFAPELARDELSAIATQLGCTAVRITGEDPARLEAAASIAVELGLTVYFSPTRHNMTNDEALVYLDETAQIAEKLRAGGAEVVFVAGLEVSLFQRGYVLGDTALERIANVRKPWRLLRGVLKYGDPQKKLNRYLAEAVGVIRQRFGGPVTYASGSWEKIDWAPFDFVGVNLYRDARNRTRYQELLRSYAGNGKPLVLTEFGCCTYRGAAGRGALGWSIVDRLVTPPRLTEPVERDEQAQAAEVLDLMDVYESEPVAGAFVFTWANYNYPYAEQPEHNLDTAGYGVVAIMADGSWRPKALFRALAAR